MEFFFHIFAVAQRQMPCLHLIHIVNVENFPPGNREGGGGGGGVIIYLLGCLLNISTKNIKIQGMELF